MQGVLQGALRELTVFGDEDDVPQRLRLQVGLGEKHHRTSRFAHQPARHVAEKLPVHRFLFQRARDKQFRPGLARRGQDGAGRIAFFILNERIFRQLQFFQGLGKFTRRGDVLFSDIDEAQSALEAIAHPSRLREHAVKPRRKSRRDGDRSVGGFGHWWLLSRAVR